MQQLFEQLRETFSNTKDPFDKVLGQQSTKQQLKSALVMDRHVIIVGPPGIGKTTLARNVADLLPSIKVNECEFHCLPSEPLCPTCKNAKEKPKTKTISGHERFVRIQGSPDLTAEDLLGDIDPIKALQFGPLSIEAFNPGKIFRANNGVLFFDEVNRCPEKLQNALLQVLQERTATIGSYTVDIPANFIFIGTMNPKDSSTEQLSDVFLDRFDIISMSYPHTMKLEEEIVLAKGKKLVEFPADLLELCIKFVRMLREHKKLEKVPSVRASIGLYERAQANAYLRGSKEVEYDDVHLAISSVLAHRIKLKPSAEYLQSPQEVVQEEFKQFFSEMEQKGSTSSDDL